MGGRFQTGSLRGHLDDDNHDRWARDHAPGNSVLHLVRARSTAPVACFGLVLGPCVLFLLLEFLTKPSDVALGRRGELGNKDVATAEPLLRLPEREMRFDEERALARLQFGDLGIPE